MIGPIEKFAISRGWASDARRLGGARRKRPGPGPRLLLCAALLAVATAQEARAQAAPLQGSDAVTTQTQTTTASTQAEPAKDDGLVECNLKGANIDRTIEFICQHAGKPVVKMKKVVAEITIATPHKVPPAEALALIYEALLLEGFAVVESEDVIKIVPVDEVKQQDLITVAGEIPDDIQSQKSRMIRKVIDLKYAKVETIKPYLEPLLGKYASVTADERTNKLIVTDLVRNIERYERMVKELDILSFDQLQIRIVPIQHGDASEIADILKAFGEGLTAGATPAPKGGSPQPDGRPPQPQPPGKPGAAPTPSGPTIVVMPDKRTNSIVIGAPHDYIERVLALLAELDTERPQDLDVHIVPIQYADASDISEAVAQLFRRTAGKSLKDTVEIEPTARENTLLILASDENYRLIEQIIKELDTEEAQRRETRQYDLKHVDAEDTARELGELYGTLQDQRYSYYSYYRSYGSSGRRDREEAKFVAVTRTNSLLVVAAPSEFDLIEGLIEKLDKPVDAEDILPRIYYIKNANALDVETVLNTVFKGEQEERRLPWYFYDYGSSDKKAAGRLSGKVWFEADENTNSIIAVTNNRANYAIVDEMIAKLDVALPSLVNTTVIPLEYENAKELADTLNNLFGRPVKPEQKKDEAAIYWSYYWGQEKKTDERPISSLIDKVRFVAHARTNSLLVTTAPHHFPVIEDIVKRLDRDEPQVLIRVRVLEVRRGDTKKLGLRWSPDAGAFSQADLDNAVSAISGLQILDVFGGGAHGTKSVSSDLVRGAAFTQEMAAKNGIISAAVNMNLVLQLLLKNLDSQIIIQPDIYVGNNQQGSIFVGDNVPRVSDSEDTPQGGTKIRFQNEDIGIKMEVTPNINQNGVVVVKVRLETSQLTGEMRFSSDIVQKREYQTEVSVQDGETMVLGGIRLSTKIKIVRKIPILGHIPLLGYLFRNYDTASETSDLYAFITPVVVSSNVAAEKVMEDIRGSVPDFGAMLEEGERAGGRVED